jgi:cytoskeletal protein CcmA (bactofilin family)
MRRLRVVVQCVLALVCIVATTPPPFAARGDRTSSDRRLSISGDVDVARGELVRGPVGTIDGSVHVRGTVTDYVVVVDGDLYVSGRVTRGAVVVHGDAHISGRVGGDVVALTGRVIVTDSGSVKGDVVSRRPPRVAAGTVDGEVRRLDIEAIATGIILGFLRYWWLAVTIMTALLGFFFVWLLPRAADTAAAAGQRVGPSFGWGALVGIIGPMVAVLVLVTILGLPLGFTMLSALNVLAPLGYVTAALIIGRIWVKGPSNRARVGAFFAGLGILRLVALLPGLGLLVWFVVCVYGIGAVSMAAWYGGHLARPASDADTPPPPSDEPPPETSAPESATTDAPVA